LTTLISQLTVSSTWGSIVLGVVNRIITRVDRESCLAVWSRESEHADRKRVRNAG
jgi:hypothetical protein